MIINISQAGERAARGISQVLKEEADEIALAAISNAPVDQGNLESAIKVQRLGGNGARDSLGRFVRTSYTIYVDGSVEAGGAKTVADYWAIMHEQLAPYGSGDYKLELRSQQKRAEGYDVGGKFMERAVVDNEKRVYARAFWEAQKALRRL